MIRRHDSTAILLMAALALVAAAGCAPKSPEERVASLRARYKATLNGFFEQRPEAPPEAAEPEGEAEGDAVEPAPEEGDPAAEMAEEPVAAEPAPTNIVLDILIQHDANERLSGLTLDILQVGPGETEKNRWRVWVDSSTIVKATHYQMSHVLEDVDYQPGDGFHVEVRHPVPAAERAEYREFAAAGG